MILQLVKVMDSTMVVTVQDTVQCAINNSALSTSIGTPTALDWFYKVSMVIIALFNIGYAIWLYRKNQDSSKERNLYESRRAMLSLLVLNHKMDSFYKYMEEIHVSTYRFVKENKTNKDLKKEIESEVSESFINLRLHFIDIFSAVDKSLAKQLQDDADKLQEVITHAIWDSGINLNIKEKYNEQIMNPLSSAQTKMINRLFNFR